MATKKSLFTYHPERNKILDGKRFSRRTTTVRPITFFKNWDSNLNTPDNSLTVQSKESPLISETAIPEKVHQSSRENAARSPILSVLGREYSVSTDDVNAQADSIKHNGTTTKTIHISSNKENDTAERSHTQRKADDVSEVYEAGEPDEGDDFNKDNDREKDPEGKGKSINSIDESTRNQGVPSNPSVGHSDSVDQEYEYEFDVEGRSIEQPGQSSGQEAIVNYLQNAGLHVSVSSRDQGVAEKSQVGVDGIQICRVPSRPDMHDTKGHSVVMRKDTGGATTEDRANSVVNNVQGNVRKDNSGLDMEDIDITHRIPIAQSTAIGVEIEQDVDEMEDGGGEEENPSKQGKNSRVLSKKEKLQKDCKSQHEFQSSSNTPLRTSKRKLVTSTPKPETSTKRTRISISTPVNVENMYGEIPQKEAAEKPHRSTKQKKGSIGQTRKQHRGSLDLPTKPSKQTPDLRKAMLLSYAKTPSGVTPSYLVKTPKSGPVMRPPKKKRPVVVPIPEDLVLSSPQRVEEVDLWQGDTEHKRHLSDTMDLDVILQTFEQVAWHYKENLDEPSVKKAITLFSKKTQAELRRMVSSCQHFKDMKTSYSRSQSIINKKRLQLLSLQKEHSRMKASIASLKLDLAAIETKAECQSDVLQFKGLMHAVKKEQSATKKGKSKVIGPTLNEQSHGIPEECLNQAKSIVSRTVQALKDKHKT